MALRGFRRQACSRRDNDCGDSAFVDCVAFSAQAQSMQSRGPHSSRLTADHCGSLANLSAARPIGALSDRRNGPSPAQWGPTVCLLSQQLLTTMPSQDASLSHGVHQMSLHGASCPCMLMVSRPCWGPKPGRYTRPRSFRLMTGALPINQVRCPFDSCSTGRRRPGEQPVFRFETTAPFPCCKSSLLTLVNRAKLHDVARLLFQAHTSPTTHAPGSLPQRHAGAEPLLRVPGIDRMWASIQLCTSAGSHLQAPALPDRSA